jgi:hypothetical protein
MKHQLIPPPELAPPSIKHLPPAMKVSLWGQMVDEGDQMVLAGLRRKLGPDADVHGAFLEWLDRYYEEHDRTLIRMMTRMRSREKEMQGA